SRLSSPHTIRIFDFGASDDGVSYIAMEHLDGADLGSIVRAHGPMPVGRVAHVAEQACLSLLDAETCGVVHRDVKPENLFLMRATGEPDFLKLLDFGVALIISPDVTGALTTTGLIMGTPAYMAPETWSGGAADARSDLYALGATLYFLLTGRAPF